VNAGGDPDGAIPPAFEKITLADLDRLLPLAAAKGKEEPGLSGPARKLTAELQPMRRPTCCGAVPGRTQVALRATSTPSGVDFDWWKARATSTT
jgi:arginyl-tRNA synthetase